MSGLFKIPDRRLGNAPLRSAPGPLRGCAVRAPVKGFAKIWLNIPTFPSRNGGGSRYAGSPDKPRTPAALRLQLEVKVNESEGEVNLGTTCSVTPQSAMNSIWIIVAKPPA